MSFEFHLRKHATCFSRANQASDVRIANRPEIFDHDRRLFSSRQRYPGFLVEGLAFSLLRQRHGKLEHFVPVLVLEMDLYRVGIDIHILADHFQ